MANSPTAVYGFPNWADGDTGWGTSVDNAFATIEAELLKRKPLTSSTTAPVSPAVNDLWFNPTRRAIQYWTGTQWGDFNYSMIDQAYVNIADHYTYGHPEYHEAAFNTCKGIVQAIAALTGGAQPSILLTSPTGAVSGVSSGWYFQNPITMWNNMSLLFLGSDFDGNGTSLNNQSTYLFDFPAADVAHVSIRGLSLRGQSNLAGSSAYTTYMFNPAAFGVYNLRYSTIQNCSFQYFKGVKVGLIGGFWRDINMLHFNDTPLWITGSDFNIDNVLIGADSNMPSTSPMVRIDQGSNGVISNFFPTIVTGGRALHINNYDGLVVSNFKADGYDVDNPTSYPMNGAAIYVDTCKGISLINPRIHGAMNSSGDVASVVLANSSAISITNPYYLHQKPGTPTIGFLGTVSNVTLSGAMYNGATPLKDTSSGASVTNFKWDEDYLNTTTAQTVNADKTFRNKVFWRAANDGAITAKPLGDGFGGVFDLKHDDNNGFLFHLHSGPNSSSNTALIGLGTDEGAAAGLLISVKSQGAGITMSHNPTASGAGLSILGYSNQNFPFRVDQYVGASPSIFVANTGAGFRDGVSQIGTTFTSATANFTAGDIGATLNQLTSTPTTPSVIPNGTTISSVTNSTTVVLSQACTGSTTGINFFVSGRVPSTSQQMLTFQAGVNFQRIFGTKTTGDTNDSFYIQEHGGLNWGPRTAGADTNLYRETANRLRTDDQLRVIDGVTTKYVSAAGKTTQVDGDYTASPQDGTIGVIRNSTDSTAKLAVRVNGSWKYVAVV